MSERRLYLVLDFLFVAILISYPMALFCHIKLESHWLRHWRRDPDMTAPRLIDLSYPRCVLGTALAQMKHGQGGLL